MSQKDLDQSVFGGGVKDTGQPYVARVAAPLARDASEQRLRDLIADAIPDPHTRLTVLLAISELVCASEKAGIAAMGEAIREVRKGG